MIKKLLKTLIIFLISVFCIYTILTFFKLQQWCNRNQITLFVVKEINSGNLDTFKLEALGNNVETTRELVELGQDELSTYNSTGYVVWLQIQSAIGEIFSYYLYISILLGFAISFGYCILNLKKINKNITKIILGYILPIVIFPLLYILIFSNIYNPFMSIYDRNNHIILFIIFYTVIFLSMFTIKNKENLKLIMNHILNFIITKKH